MYFSAVIKSSIIFPNSEVGEKSEVNMCIIGINQTVNSRGILTNFYY